MAHLSELAAKQATREALNLATAEGNSMHRSTCAATVAWHALCTLKCEHKLNGACSAKEK